MRMTGRPSAPCGGSCVLFPDDGASTNINSPACVLWPPNIRSNLYHHESPYCIALSNINVWNAFEGVTSEYRCLVLVLRWCGVYGMVCILRNFCENPGCVWVQCMRVRVLPIPSASVPLFNLQTRWSETFRELTMRTVILIGHSTTLRRFVKWVLQSYQGIWDWLIKEAIIWNTLSYVCKNGYCVIFHSERYTWIQLRKDLVSSQFEFKYFAHHLEQRADTFWPLTICRTTHCQERIHPGCSNKRLYWGTMGADIEFTSG